MKQFTAHDVDSVSGLLAELDQDTADQIMQDFSTAQPYVLAYLVGNSEIFEDDEDAESVILLGVLVWMLYKGQNPDLKLVGEDTIAKVEKDLIAELEKIEKVKDPEKFKNTLQKWQDSQPQTELMNYLLVETNEFLGEKSGVAVSILLTVLRAFEKMM